MFEDILYFLKVSFPKRSTLTLAFSPPSVQGALREVPSLLWKELNFNSCFQS